MTIKEKYAIARKLYEKHLHNLPDYRDRGSIITMMAELFLRNIGDDSVSASARLTFAEWFQGKGK